MKRLIYLFIILSLTGCASSIRFSPGEIRSFSEDIQRHIEKGEVVTGMTYIQVRYAWGAPQSVNVLEPVNGKYREEWIYSSTGILKTRLIFVDGVLMSIITTEPGIVTR